MNGVRKALVVAPHPDDEILGAGGLIARLKAEGAEVEVAVVTKGMPPLFDEETIATGREELAQAHEYLRIDRTHFLDFAAAALDSVPHYQLNAALLDLVESVSPDLLVIPFGNDIHRDHQLVFESCLVAARPNRKNHPRTVLAYETLSESNWNAPYVVAPFVPNFFVDISAYLANKLHALSLYRSQLREPPHERSLEAVNALAVLRGSTVSVPAAEGFVLVRSIV